MNPTNNERDPTAWTDRIQMHGEWGDNLAIQAAATFFFVFHSHELTKTKLNNITCDWGDGVSATERPTRRPENKMNATSVPKPRVGH